ncbi:hypothetical protein KAR91_26140 [Candidatus Pacearchaeota archaeon]|nr:hypothetical protein [Candidatus Pacearchaeota archaeon]
MADLATLFIKVDSKGVVTASKDLNKLTGDSKKTEKATDGVTASFNKMKVAVAAVAAALATLKISQYIKDATLLAARYETLGVVMGVVGNNAGFSSKQMEGFAKGLQKAGIAMIESRTTLARMVQAQIDLTKSSELARIAQDAAVIGNINSSESFERMILGIQRGMPRILTTIGLNVDFNRSYKDLAASLDVNVGALTQLQRIQARTNAVVKSGVLIQGSYEASMETAGKQILSLKRHTDNLKVAFGEAFTPALLEIVEGITGNIKGLNKELAENRDAIKDWGVNLRLSIISVEIAFLRVKEALEGIARLPKSLLVANLAPNEIVIAYKAWKAAISGVTKAVEVLSSTTDQEKSLGAIDKLIGKQRLLEFSLTDMGKAWLARGKAYREEKLLQLKATEELNKAVEDATKDQLKIQADFARAFNKSTLTTQQFELASLKIQVDAFRKAKVNEVQLEEWMQNEIKNIKLRARHEELALLEELAESDSAFAQQAINVMSEILDAEEKKWAKILKDDDAAHTLRIQKEEAYRDKVLGTIDDITEAQTQATRQLISGTAATPAASSAPSSLSGSDRIGQEFQTFEFQGQSFSSEAAMNAAVQNLRAITEATQAAAEESARIAEDAARKAQDIANQRIDLEIQLLEATGHATEAVGIRRMQELAAMDESLRPLQERLFSLEDEAAAIDAANQQVADAQSEAARAAQDLVSAEKAAERATDELAKAQQRQAEASRNSLADLVSQGRTIQDFINSLGTTGSAMTLSVARAAYAADLAGARAGDAPSFQRVTQSAGAFISSATQGAGSAVDAARIVADIKSELSSLAPVAELEDNMEALAIANNELLELIAASTEDTAGSTSNTESNTADAAASAQEAAIIAAQTELNTANAAVSAAQTRLNTANTALQATLTAQATISANTTGWDKNNPVKGIFDAIMASTEATKLAAENTARGVKWSYLPVTETAVNVGDGHGGDLFITPSGKVTSAPGLTTTYTRLANYAHGGAFTNGIVTQPTAFNNSQMGEAGPEAIMPLTRGPQGLGVRAAGGDSSPEQVRLLKELVAELKVGNFQISKNTGKTAKVLNRFDFDGMPPERTQ